MVVWSGGKVGKGQSVPDGQQIVRTLKQEASSWKSYLFRQMDIHLMALEDDSTVYCVGYIISTCYLSESQHRFILYPIYIACRSKKAKGLERLLSPPNEQIVRLTDG